MLNGPVPAFQALAGMEHHPLLALLMLPFLLIFLRATWLELRRWYLYGPSRNNRAMFDFDESAPGHLSNRK
ncbi:hypothetical protein ACFORG_21470 [Lutimaribacter marinistellae]|uniref:Uncharacterized protein n=1 Tax=Lutimaribacter marinistellae TaxID=1820329 RepID=A0ABV7TL03_9RHOB